MWYEEYDFYENPLSTDPEESSSTMVGCEDALNELYYRIDSGSMAFIEGAEGSGKTSVLYRLIERYKGKKKVIYFDCSTLDKKLNIERLMKSRFGAVGNLFNIIPKDMIVLLDNVSDLGKKNAERIKYYFDQNYIKAIVFTGTSYAQTSLPKSIKERIGRRVVRLEPLSEEQAVDVVRQRLKEVELIPDAIVIKAFKASGRNIKEMLVLLNDACELAAQGQEQTVSDKHLKSVLGDKNA